VPNVNTGDQVSGIEGQCARGHQYPHRDSKFNGNSATKPIVYFIESYTVDGQYIPSAFFYTGSDQAPGAFNQKAGDAIKPPSGVNDKPKGERAKAIEACKDLRAVPKALAKCIFDYMVIGPKAQKENQRDRMIERLGKPKQPTLRTVRDLTKFRNDGLWITHLMNWECAGDFLKMQQPKEGSVQMGQGAGNVNWAARNDVHSCGYANTAFRLQLDPKKPVSSLNNRCINKRGKKGFEHLWSVKQAKSKDVKCQGLPGQYVYVVQRRADYLTLCEVEVYADAMFWRARSGPKAYVPLGVPYNKNQLAFHFAKGGESLTIDLPTNPSVFKTITYEAWVKVVKYGGKGYVMAQSPDYGSSRGMAVNDPAIGGASVTVGADWDAKASKPATGKWFHMAGTWKQGGSSTVYINGVKGMSFSGTNNGRQDDTTVEELIIGGIQSFDPSNGEMFISDIRVYDRVLTPVEVETLYERGRRSKKTK